ncbi:thiol:disulfide interchange protein DsbA/DsbL [Arenimonas sp. MALMAid1274]|uniref:thiol:disulfide interchange protein DsbA/DsbL n=1 Tax=Arenimonas sp. MALMAid1274 TaxID=3411630 RepID=UPI003BA0C14A
MKRLLPLLMVLSLAACGDKPADEAAAPAAAPTEAAAAPAAEPGADVTPADPASTAATAAPAPGEPGAIDPAAETAPADTSAASGTPAPGEPGAVAAAPEPAPAMPDPANAPREGIDYKVLPEPQPTFGQGGIEVAEVFAYTCIHCANLQPAIDTWKPRLPSDVRFVYVPGAFGGIGDNFARAYYAAETMGLLEKTHSKMFNAVFVEKAFTNASEEEIADWYATQGANRDAFLSTMKSFAVTAKLNKARQFAMRTNIESTPTLIIAGKYSAQQNERGPDGLFRTIEWLVARERAQAAGN